jgi:glutamyl-tRNA synthetase
VTWTDFWEQGKIFFVAPTTYDSQLVAKKWNADVAKVLGAYADELEGATAITAESAKALLESVAMKLNIKPGQILQVLRMTITGGSSGPDLMATLEILGNAESARRIRNAIQNIPLAS